MVRETLVGEKGSELMALLPGVNMLIIPVWGMKEVNDPSLQTEWYRAIGVSVCRDGFSFGGKGKSNEKTEEVK